MIKSYRRCSYFFLVTNLFYIYCHLLDYLFSNSKLVTHQHRIEYRYMIHFHVLKLRVCYFLEFLYLSVIVLLCLLLVRYYLLV